MKRFLAIITIIGLLGTNSIYAADEHGDLAKQATNPMAPLIQFQVQNHFVFESMEEDGYANQLITSLSDFFRRLSL